MKRLITNILAFVAVFFVFASPVVGAQGLVGCDGSQRTDCNVIGRSCKDAPSDAALCEDNGEQQTAKNNTLFGKNGIITKATSLIAMIIGVAAVIMIIVGGIQYVLSSGDGTNTKNAKNTILYALIGLVVAIMAQSIIAFVLVKI